jgi:CRISPR/Cas system-associated exonuclease Cas4 (RecB family)
MVAAHELEKAREGLHVSYSQVRTYTICPAKFEHNYVVRTEPSHRPVALVLGGAVHHALAHFYMNVKTTGEKIAESDFLDMFREKIDAELDASVPIRFDDGEDEGAMIDQGVGLLKMFHQKADCPTVLAVEQPFNVDIFDPASGEILDLKLTGVMDLLVQGENQPRVIEHKTASKRYASWQLEFETQPTVYKYAARQIGMGEVDLCYQLLIKTKVPSLQLCPIDRTESHEREMMETFTGVLKAIESGIFFRNRSWACQDCQFRYKCDEAKG